MCVCLWWCIVFVRIIYFRMFIVLYIMFKSCVLVVGIEVMCIICMILCMMYKVGEFGIVYEGMRCVIVYRNRFFKNLSLIVYKVY